MERAVRDRDTEAQPVALREPDVLPVALEASDPEPHTEGEPLDVDAREGEGCAVIDTLVVEQGEVRAEALAAALEEGHTEELTQPVDEAVTWGEAVGEALTLALPLAATGVPVAGLLAEPLPDAEAGMVAVPEELRDTEAQAVALDA